MHLAVIAGILGFALKKPLGIKAAGVVSIGCIIGYVYLLGNLPSLHRAAIMYVLGALGVLGSLPRTPMPLLAMTFLIQLCLEPESGRSISFILSYLSLGGILSLSEIIYDLIRGKIPKTPAQALSASLGAFIATAPCSALFFGVLRPAGIVAGIILAPLTMLFMAGAMLLLAADEIAPFLVPFVELFLSAVYAILKRLISLCAFAPGVSAGPVPVLLGSLGVSALCIVLYIRHRARRSRFAPFD
jgi:competence protein ComEC